MKKTEKQDSKKSYSVCRICGKRIDLKKGKRKESFLTWDYKKYYHNDCLLWYVAKLFEENKTTR